MSLNSFFLALLSARAASLSQFLLPAHSVIRGLLHPSYVVKVGNRDTHQPLKAHITENQKSAFQSFLVAGPDSVIARSCARYSAAVRPCLPARAGYSQTA